jgi:hypothetical protein
VKLALALIVMIWAGCGVDTAAPAPGGTGGIGTTISGTGKVTLVDRQMSHAPGDFLVMAGGTLHMTYSAIGLEPGQRDSTHCNMHRHAFELQHVVVRPDVPWREQRRPPLC